MPELSLAIVGAGIGGLTAALALSDKGHSVTLIERRTGFSEVGAGLQLSPNASRHLIALGLGAALKRIAGEPDRVVVRAIRSGKTIGEVALGAFMRARFGAPYWVAHRADLQTILLDAVRSRPAIRLLTGRTLDSFENGNHRVDLSFSTESGVTEKLAADALIGADGVWSKLRASLSDSNPPSFQGFVAWRAVVERSRVPAVFQGNETGLWLGPQGHVVHYPIAEGRLINIVAIERRGSPVEGWAAPGDATPLLAQYKKAAPALRELLASAESWLLWSLFDRPAEYLAQGRVALLGDAAHPILPFLAQGAALAIEDAATLAASLPIHSADIPEALQAYEKTRLDRARRIQAEARKNGRIYHAGSLLAFGRDAVMRCLGPKGTTERYAWLYGHQVDP